jgi:RNA-binding protein NOB1
MATEKPIHTLVIDTGALIKNDPPISTLLASTERLITVPAIISEIKDAATRARVETTVKPFLELRSPNPASVKVVTDFARKTGDLSVLSRPDLLICALAYEVECERNGGDWRLRRVPGQKGLNGSPPKRNENGEIVKEGEEATAGAEAVDQEAKPAEDESTTEVVVPAIRTETTEVESSATSVVAQTADEVTQIASNLESTSLEGQPEASSTTTSEPLQEEDAASDSGSDGWITPSNLKKKQAEDSSKSTKQTPEPATMQVATLTSDFAMQNVLLQMNLNLLSPSLTRVKYLKTYVLRCHACFTTSRDLSKQFCARCGQPALTRVSCSTSANGEFKLHLKKNMQWNSRGDRYSIPKPVHGSSNGRIKGGGKGGWGHELILAEDQKEYAMKSTEEKRKKERGLMDEDYLPGILTGQRTNHAARIKVGAGRSVNSKKR